MYTVGISSRHASTPGPAVVVAVVFTLDHIVTTQTTMGWTKSLLYRHRYRRVHPHKKALRKLVEVNCALNLRDYSGQVSRPYAHTCIPLYYLYTCITRHIALFVSGYSRLSTGIVLFIRTGNEVCRYDWHSAGSAGWPFPLLK